MKKLKYRGGIHALKKNETDVYHGLDGRQAIHLAVGDETDVSDEKADQVAADFPGCFDVNGKTAGEKPSKSKSGKKQPAPADDDDLAGKLMAHNRDELNAAAAKLGIEDADKLQNKQAVVDAIIAKKAETAA